MSEMAQIPFCEPNEIFGKIYTQYLSSKGILTDEVINSQGSVVDWNFLSEHYDFSLDMLRKYQQRVNWCHILRRLKLSEGFLREMTTNFDGCWSTVSMYQTLSLEFIHDFAHKVDWDLIILYQNVPTDFLKSHVEFMSTHEECLTFRHSDNNDTDVEDDSSEKSFFDYPDSLPDDY